MPLKKINYSELNARQKEIYRFQKFAAHLAEYGFNCIKLADDWLGADFIAYHKDGKETFRVQLKSRLTIDKKYLDKNLWIAFPYRDVWYLVEHDVLVKLVQRHTNWTNTASWLDRGLYHSAAPNSSLLNALSDYVVQP